MTTTHHVRAATVLVVGMTAAAAVAPVAGQEPVESFGPARVTLGPVGLTPTLSNTMGVDNNVFNQAQNPKRDFTALLVPAVDGTMRMGRVAARLKSEVSLIYYQKYFNQRAVNFAQDLAVSARFLRVTPFARLQYVNARERPSIEIDSRVRREMTDLGGGVQVAVGPKVSVRLRANQHQTAFAETIFEGADLRQLLNHRTTTLEGALGYQLTPLTRVGLLAAREQDRFDLTPSRNTDSFRIAPTVEFAPTALISGRASVGMRAFDIADQLVSDFTGLVASLDLAYTFRGATRFGLRVDRDTAYSFSVVSPYYILTSVGVTLTQRLTSAWEVTAFAEQQHLNYAESSRVAVQASTLADPIAAVPPVDLLGSSGRYRGGLGYHFGRGSQISFLVDYSNRPAGLRGRYRNVRAYSTINYGF